MQAVIYLVIHTEKLKTERKKTLSKQTLAYCIKDEKWDVISFQQVSTQSGMYESYFLYLNDLLDYVKAMVPNPKVKYVFASNVGICQESDT